MNDKVIFLTEKNIDKNLLLDVMKSHSTIIRDTDNKKIITEVTSLIEQDKFYLSPQEVQFLNLNPKDMWCDYLIFRYKFNTFPKNQIVSDFPIYVLIEPVSACNLRCVMCFQIDETFTSNKNFMGKMDISLFKKIIDQCVEGGTKAITLASRGEPTLHPQLGEMLEYCTGKFYGLKLNTNATRLTDKLSHQILKSGVTDLVYSIDSYAKEEYEVIRVKGIFDEVLNNIIRFKEIKEQHYPNSKCSTRISGVKINDKQDPIKFKEFWEKYVDHVVMVEMEQRWDTYHNPKEIAGVHPCDYLWERLYVWHDGICNPCDIDYKSELSVGTLSDSTIKEIWTSQKFSRLRDLHKNGKRNLCYPCDRCPVGS
jgi:radical SAM protein with 4Fe4S-binding SPASM domain